MLPRRTAMAPRRKLRGKRRYFQSIARDARLQHVIPTPDGWWNIWHYHADWPGWGNVSWRYRREHIRALCTVYGSILDIADNFETPFQAWVDLDEDDAGLDAVYLHTPNPNTPFPLALPVEWSVSPLEPLFSRLLPEVSLRFGTLSGSTSRGHIVWAKDFGVPLDGPPTKT